jgi:hypothetical protein
MSFLASSAMARNLVEQGPAAKLDALLHRPGGMIS